MEKADRDYFLERLHGIYRAAGGITGEQQNHMIAMAIMNEAQGLIEKITKEAGEKAGSAGGGV